MICSSIHDFYTQKTQIKTLKAYQLILLFNLQGSCCLPVKTECILFSRKSFNTYNKTGLQTFSRTPFGFQDSVARTFQWLEILGFVEKTRNWFYSFLTNRSQRVKIGKSILLTYLLNHIASDPNISPLTIKAKGVRLNAGLAFAASDAKAHLTAVDNGQAYSSMVW